MVGTTMRSYTNPRGNSGVVGYETGADYIDIEFREGGRYRYTHQVPGRQHVEVMKQLAAEGQHLATYINQHVRERYALRLR